LTRSEAGASRQLPKGQARRAKQSSRPDHFKRSAEKLAFFGIKER